MDRARCHPASCSGGYIAGWPGGLFRPVDVHVVDGRRLGRLDGLVEGWDVVVVGSGSYGVDFTSTKQRRFGLGYPRVIALEDGTPRAERFKGGWRDRCLLRHDGRPPYQTHFTWGEAWIVLSFVTIRAEAFRARAIRRSCISGISGTESKAIRSASVNGSRR